ncbi:C4-dicarboxylate TRAP transporter substrate-binding protein [Seohaeicola zhoushanensis]|uniref:C4-dicarboxylate ABC transporter substrate-binding protein n=1 Tax=Seohaeicola zhoushanensis TaxID=1569283 RepID=A0A8J3M8T4_9RHOB|nr:C4-dicarboxylate TRAP transporter substrate-binding protein [Seohaeicola zhoushanensis]GHF62451.1 hypothetical protein GCM10017056_37270 [Seohaeicola zhoushanensis]
MKRLTALRSTLTAAALLSVATAAGATDIRYATGFAPGTTGANTAIATAEKLSELTNGAMKMEVFPQSLLSFGEMNAGVRDGIADAGFVLLPYFPAEFRNTGMIADLTMIFTLKNTGDRGGLAWTGALTEYIMLNCDACQAEMAAQNQVYTSTSATEYSLMCTKPLGTAEDLKGLKIRVAGANWSRWAQDVGATPVSLPQNELYEGLSQGIIDCTISGMTEINDAGLSDVLKAVMVDVPGGGFGGSAMMNINRDVWQSLSVDERMAYAKAATFAGAKLAWDYRVGNTKGRETAEAKGIDVVDADAALRAATEEWIHQDFDGIAKLYAEKYALKGTDESVATFMQIFEKWTGLVANVDGAEALSDLIWEQIGTKVDFNTYGM